MARSTFLGTTDFALFEKTAAGYWKDADQPKTLTFSDADGNPVSVLVDGVEVSEVVVPAGELPPFVQGPDGMDILYVDAGGGRVPVGPSRGSAAPTWAALPDKPDVLTRNPALTVSRDVFGRVESVTEGGVTETVARDTFGRVSTITTGTTTRTVTRDNAGRISEVN